MNSRKVLLSFAAVAACVCGAFGATYRQAEYVTLSEGATIPTGVTITDTMEIRFKFMMEKGEVSSTPFTDYADDNTNVTQLKVTNTKQSFYAYFVSKNYVTVSNVGVANALHEGYLNKSSMRIDAKKVSISRTAGNANTKELSLVSTATCPTRIYWFQIWDTVNGERKLVLDLVPAYDPDSPTTCGLWDGQKLLVPASGAITSGPMASGLKIMLKDICLPFDGVHPVRPEPAVCDAISGTPLDEGSDYELSIEGASSEVGTGTITAVRKGGYGDGLAATLQYELVTDCGGNFYYATPNPTYDPDSGAEIATAAKTQAGFDVQAWSLLSLASKLSANDRIILLKGRHDLSGFTGGTSVLTFKKDQLDCSLVGETGDPKDVIVVGGGLNSKFRFAFLYGSSSRISMQAITVQDFAVDEAGAAISGTGAGGTIVSKCRFIGNVAKTGGAISTSGSCIRAVDCCFESNKFTSVSNSRGAGGGAVNGADCVRCEFIGNGHATPDVENKLLGGAVCDGDCVDCTFIGNVAAAGATAAASVVGGSVLCTRCSFVGNKATKVNLTENLSCSECSFVGNQAENGMILSAAGMLSRCSIISNVFYSTCVQGPSATARNCLFYGNQAESTTTSGAGGICALSVENCTAISNVHPVRVFSGARVVNALLSGNLRRDLKTLCNLAYGINSTITNCVSDSNHNSSSVSNVCVMSTSSMIAWNADGVPCGIVRNAQTKRVLIDCGYDLGQTAEDLDLAGKPRVFNDIIDIGCWEWPGPFPGLMLLVR